MKSPRMRATGALGVVLLVASVLVVGPLGSAQAGASAQGCTAAPGPAGAYTCVKVNGSGLYVKDAYSSYAATNSNICNITAQFRYRYSGESSYRTWTISSKTCAVLRGYVRAVFNNRKMANGSSFCARQKNNVTGYAYTNWACVTIRA